MSRIAIIGGHGKIALLLSPLLTGRGDEVTSVIRNPAHTADVEATGASAVVADVENLSATQIAEVIAGHDAIVWSAGAGGGDPDRTYAVDRDAAIRTMDAAQLSGILRFVMVSYLGAGPDHGVPEDSSFYPYAEAKAAADEHLRESALDWTILQPSRLTDGPGTGAIAVSEVSGDVPRADVAEVAAQVLARQDTVGTTVPFVGGRTPIAEALTALTA
ncbi:SDR family oxidoreductase [Ruania halotolerans]|uniref:SDR family oxidoreductase n=1 Tax=Ruania halotolerans TaxID=2897773 RepID=UPI001E5F8101|nr:SDR family oxidoreductase [Ruania halotolerans]UFU05649.1 SDR family oxidoreductase [Ruania halotolerans]